MAYCVLNLYNIPVPKWDKQRFRLYPLVQDSWIFQGYLPDGRSFRPPFSHRIKCSKMNCRTLTKCSQKGKRYQRQCPVSLSVWHNSLRLAIWLNSRDCIQQIMLCSFSYLVNLNRTHSYMQITLSYLIICIVFTTKLSLCLKEKAYCYMCCTLGHSPEPIKTHIHTYIYAQMSQKLKTTFSFSYSSWK